MARAYQFDAQGQALEYVIPICSVTNVAGRLARLCPAGSAIAFEVDV